MAARPKPPRAPTDDLGEQVGSVVPAVQRMPRLVALHVARQEPKLARRDVRRDGGYDVGAPLEGRRQWLRPPAPPGGGAALPPAPGGGRGPPPRAPTRPPAPPGGR